MRSEEVMVMNVCVVYFFTLNETCSLLELFPFISMYPLSPLMAEQAFSNMGKDTKAKPRLFPESSFIMATFRQSFNIGGHHLRLTVISSTLFIAVVIVVIIII